jgi:hypothetical protein
MVNTRGVQREAERRHCDVDRAREAMVVYPKKFCFYLEKFGRSNPNLTTELGRELSKLISAWATVTVRIASSRAEI